MQGRNQEENSFDIKNYINERLLEIDDNEKRREYRMIFDEFFVPFYDYLEERQIKLEDKCLAKASHEKQQMTLITALAPLDKIMAYEETMFPICEEDLEEQILDVAYLVNCMEQKKECFCYSAYMELPYEQLQQLIKEQRYFKGVVRTTEAEFEARFMLKASDRYQKKLQMLYEVFMKNQVNWNTPNIPYIYKMVDVYLVEGDYIAEGVVESIKVDFEEYADVIYYKMVPVWNVGNKKLRSSAYPTFEVDQVNYTHVIYDSQLREDCQYLVANEDVDFWGTRREHGDLCIACKKVDPVTWNLLEIHQEIKCYYKEDFKRMSNQRKAFHQERVVRTKASIKRFMDSLMIDEYLEWKDVQKVTDIGSQYTKSYSMNATLEEEFQSTMKKQGLLFTFQAKASSPRNQDILSYAISTLQWELREYDCYGRLE